jgi:hypothetical protein
VSVADVEATRLKGFESFLSHPAKYVVHRDVAGERANRPGTPMSNRAVRDLVLPTDRPLKCHPPGRSLTGMPA